MEDKNKGFIGRDVGAGLSLGVQMAAFVAIGAFIGYHSDQYLGTRPWGITAGVVIGSFVGIWDVIRMSFLLSDPVKKERDEK